MSIASVSKLFTSKAGNILKTCMRKGFKVKGDVPNSLVKQLPGGDKFLKELSNLGYKNVSLKGGVKGGKNTVTGLVHAYSGKTHIGYLAGGLDANAAKPIVQIRGQILPQRGMSPIRFNVFADGNKAITQPLDASLNVTLHQGKAVLNTDAGAVKGYVSGDAKQVMSFAQKRDGRLFKGYQDLKTKLDSKWQQLFEPRKPIEPLKVVDKKTDMTFEKIKNLKDVKFQSKVYNKIADIDDFKSIKNNGFSDILKKYNV